MILSRQRSKSSFTGNILQQSSDVFYVYEPLHDLQKDIFATMAAIFPGFHVSWTIHLKGVVKLVGFSTIFQRQASFMTSSCISAPHSPFGQKIYYKRTKWSKLLPVYLFLSKEFRKILRQCLTKPSRRYVRHRHEKAQVKYASTSTQSG